MVCFFKKGFLSDLAGLPAIYRKRIEKIVFEDIPGMDHLDDTLDIQKIQGYEKYYRIRIGNYRIGCEIQTHDKIVFYRVKDRKDIYRVFP